MTQADILSDTTLTTQEDSKLLTPLCRVVGGKRDQAHRIASLLPTILDHYLEPFCGGGAVFFHLKRTGRLKQTKSTTLNDIERPLIDLYEAVKLNPQEISEKLRHIEEIYAQKPEETYYYVRELWNQRNTSPAKCLFLRSSSFNGLWRESKSGRMNAPFGKRKSLALPSVTKLQAVSRAFKTVDFDSANFEEHLRFNDFLKKPNVSMYIDPPYLGSWASYTRHGWTLKQLTTLIEIGADWAESGATIVMSHSNTEQVRDLLKAHWPFAHIHEVPTRNKICRDGTKREVFTELLITNSTKSIAP